MQVPAQQLREVRFESFLVDFSAHEVRQNGSRMKLQEKPFQILAILLERPGEVVSREDLRQRLWPSDEFVDFEHAINTAIKKLREALADDANKPHFIETVPRRGYRFIARLDGPSSAEDNPSLHSWRQDSLVLRDWRPQRETWSSYFIRLARWPKLRVLSFVVLCAVLLAFSVHAPYQAPRIVGSRQITDDGLPKFSLVSNGSTIYFNETPAGAWAAPSSITQVSVKGGEAVTLSLPFFRPVLNDISPTDSELLVDEEPVVGLDGPYFSVPFPVGSPRRLGDVVGHDAVWTRDGKLAFIKGSDLYFAEHDGRNPRKVGSLPDQPSNLRFSPDGTRLTFTVTDPLTNASAIWEGGADGTNLRPLFAGWNNPPAECCGIWSTDGKYFFFQSTRSDGPNVWVVPDRARWWGKKSLEAIQLTTGPLQFMNPYPSRDGRELFVIGAKPRAELVRYDSKSRGFVPYLGGMSAGDVEFSRDGQWLTYISFPEGTLWRSKVDGSARLQLTHAPIHAFLPHWSPDGEQIAFMGIISGKPWKVFLISRDGGTPKPITSDEIVEGDPTWSPDGTRLAFGHVDPRHSEQTFIEVFDASRGQISKLPGSEEIYAPRWSPDGHYIVGISFDQKRLMLYEFENHTWNILPTPLTSFGYLTWSADSSYVYLDAVLRGNYGFYRVRVRDDEIERLIDLTNIRQFLDPIRGAWNGLGPGDTPMFTRDISLQEIYALDLRLP